MGKAMISAGGSIDSIKLGVDEYGNLGYYLNKNSDLITFNRPFKLIHYQYQTGASYQYNFSKAYNKVIIVVFSGDSDNNNDNSGSLSVRAGTSWKTMGIKQTLSQANFIKLATLIDNDFGTTLNSHLDGYFFGYVFMKENVLATDQITLTVSHGRVNHFLLFDASDNISILDYLCYN